MYDKTRSDDTSQRGLRGLKQRCSIPAEVRSFLGSVGEGRLFFFPRPLGLLVPALSSSCGVLRCIWSSFRRPSVPRPSTRGGGGFRSLGPRPNVPSTVSVWVGRERTTLSARCLMAIIHSRISKSVLAPKIKGDLADLWNSDISY